MSGYNIPNKFNLELFAFISKKQILPKKILLSHFTKLLNGQYDGITDDDKNQCGTFQPILTNQKSRLVV